MKITLCGQVKSEKANMIELANKLRESGVIVYTPVFTDDLMINKALLITIHNMKIIESDLIIVVGEYIGDDTANEILLAQSYNIPIYNYIKGDK